MERGWLNRYINTSIRPPSNKPILQKSPSISHDQQDTAPIGNSVCNNPVENNAKVPPSSWQKQGVKPVKVYDYGASENIEQVFGQQWKEGKSQLVDRAYDV